MSDSVDTTVDTTSSRERIKRALSHGKKGRINKDLSNKIMLGVFRAAAYITTLVLVAIIAYVVINGLPHISLDFIFGWPQGVNAEGGIWPTIVSTVYVTALAMLICTPIAVLAAVYLAEYAKQGKVVELIRYAADALASVPSIVMGLFGYALFVEAMGLGLSMVSAALALALLMLPIVMRTTEEAIRAVPRYIRCPRATAKAPLAWAPPSGRLSPRSCFLLPLAVLPRASFSPSAVPLARPRWCSIPWGRPSIYLFRRSIPAAP